jgi:hypothetical protein
VTAKPKRKPRKVVVWAVVDRYNAPWNGACRTRHQAREMVTRRNRPINGFGKWTPFRVVRCEGVLR